MKKKLELFKSTIDGQYFLIDFDFWATIAYIEISLGLINISTYNNIFVSLPPDELPKIKERLKQSDIELPEIPEE